MTLGQEEPIELAPTRTPSSNATDEEIVARVVAGETALYEQLMRRHNSRVYRAARAILRDDSEAEDVMQDAYVRAYEHLAEFEGRARFSTWLLRIAVNEALARVRRIKRFDTLGAEHEEPSVSMQLATSPEQHASDVEMRIVLEAAVAKLPDDFRSVFVLRAVEGMSAFFIVSPKIKSALGELFMDHPPIEKRLAALSEIAREMGRPVA